MPALIAPTNVDAVASVVHIPKQPSVEHTIAKTITARHSTRAFCPNTPVPIDILEECLRISQQAPSSTNIQPWRLTFVSGDPLQRISTALVAAFDSGKALDIPDIPPQFQHFRSELGQQIYGPNGYDIPRDDKGANLAAVRSNFRFYDAPMVAIVGIDRSLANADILSVGIYIQTLVLLLTERGLGTCLAVSTAGYPDIIRKELSVGDDVEVLCTLAIGFENESQSINKLQMPREDWRKNVEFVQ